MDLLLNIQNLHVSFISEGTKNIIVTDFSLQLNTNEIYGIVGESGSGKSVSTLAVLGLLPKKNCEVTGSIFFNGINLRTASEKKLQQIRGKQISMIFQEPMSSLNPSVTCGKQVQEILLQHENLTKSDAKQEVLSLFEQVKLPRVTMLYDQYPHQLSGGQKQRVMIAMAIACKPQILIADEPTTALDVTVQKEIILLLKELQQANNMSILFISHDLALVSEIADQVLVMYKGKIVERGSALEIFNFPKQEYTKALIYSKPNLKQRLKQLPTVKNFIENTVSHTIISSEERTKLHQKIYAQAPLLRIENVATYFTTKKLFQKQKVVKAVDGVSFNMYEGETVGLVGESGCGKTTLGRTILQLEKVTSGQIYYKNQDITTLSKKALKAMRKEIQIIFQDPFSSLNPRIMIGEAILEPMKVHGIFNTKQERKDFVIELLHKVGLDSEHYYRYPHEFSGGQRQRIGIARTIALQPKLVICDESVAALDVSVQAQVLNLLNKLKEDYGFTYLFISHDLSVVKYMSDQLLVMNKGKLEEKGDADAIYKNPQKEYTKRLIAAIPKGI